MPLAFSYGAERAPNLVVVSARWCWWTQWSKVAVVDNAVSQSLVGREWQWTQWSQSAAADNTVGQRLRTKVAMLGTLMVHDADGLLLWCRISSGRGGRGGTRMVVDTVVTVCSCR
jgi:hypothetical protein